MKKLILLAAFISLIISSRYSQQRPYIQTDTTFKKRLIDSTAIHLNFQNHKEFQSLFNNSTSDTGNIYFNNPYNEFYLNESWLRSLMDSTKNYDNMPIILSKGKYPTTIIAPDTSINFYLKIKRP